MMKSTTIISRLYVFIRGSTLLFLLEGIVATGLLFRVPSNPESVIFWGLSKSRLLFLCFLVLVDLLVLWLAIHFLRVSRLSIKIVGALEGIINHKHNLWLAIFGLELGLVVCGFGLSQWGLLASDQQIRAYLLRLTPFLILGLCASFQGLGVLMLVYRQRPGSCVIFLKIIAGGYGLLLVFYVVEFFVLDISLPWLFIQETYGDAFLHFITLAIPQWVLLAQWVLMTRKLERLRISQILYLCLLLCTAVFYFQGATHHAQEMNTEVELSDQLGFVRFTQEISHSNFRYTGDRNQAPGYPYIQAVFCGNQVDELAIFSCGKQVNIWLSIILLGMVFWISKSDLGLEAGLCLTLVTTFSIFIFKAGYFKVDLIYYFAIFLSFLLMVRMLISPTLALGLGTGIALGLTQLLKASTLPGMVLFVLFLLVKFINSFVEVQRGGKKLQENSKSLWRSLSGLLLVIVGFLAVQFPYLWENQQRYGSLFYNINTEVYLWYDSFEEAKQARAHYDEFGTWLGIYENTTPGLGSYLERHTVPVILARLGNGIRVQSHYMRYLYNPLNYLALYTGFLACLFIGMGRGVFSRVRANRLMLLFLGLYLGGYFFLYAWYTPIGSGPRFIYSLFLPALWSVLSAIQVLSRDGSFHLLGRSIRMADIMIWVHRLVIGMVTYDAVVVITRILPQGYFGS